MADFDRNAPATKGDLQDLKDELRLEIRAQRDELRLEIRAQKDELIEAIRDNQTEVLKAFCSFAETNQKRLSSVERDSAELKERLAIVESRVMALEKRLNMPPAA